MDVNFNSLKIKVIILFFLGISSPLILQAQNWTLQGSNIDGVGMNNQLGSSVALSSEGNTLVVGSPLHDSEKGTVQVYTWNANNSTWEKKGSEIDGATGDRAGSSVSISSDGNIIAIGAPGPLNTFSSDRAGFVMVYAWNATNSTWEKRGSNITLTGGANGDSFGISVSLSSDGSILAVGAREHAGGAGTVAVYTWNAGGSTWDQRGADIDGVFGDRAGTSVSLSSDGSILAVGVSTHNATGTTRVYTWNAGGSTWDQRGADIDGTNTSDNSGYSVALSSNGDVVAIGSPGHESNKGTTCVYTWNAGGSTWDQRGADIDGVATNDRMGWSVALSADGNY